MIYNRMEAKPIKGEHCYFCKEEGLPLIKTRCCNKWICCDTDYISIRGGGYCQFEHESYSACYFHYNEGHKGTLSKCKECRDFFDADEYESSLKYQV